MTELSTEAPPAHTETNPPPRSFPIAGIGISAGGLAPVRQLLHRLGADPGIGLVLISHLDPTHESSLVEILSKVTPMRVQAARNGDLVQPNHVYVMSPNTELGMASGALRLVPRPEGPGPHMPIDHFLRALAEDQGRRAIGVILSGTGSDGSRGVEAIKAQQGTTFAQDDTAEHRDMPRSAIATGAIDFVSSPEAIAAELAGIGSRPRTAHAQPGPSDDDEPVQRILLAVRHATGIDFSQYKRTTLMRRIQRRASLHRISSMREYADFVASAVSEAEALSEEVLIHVTSFFRDPATFDALDALVFPRLLAERRRDLPIRVWVPGCSTGEEVYSIAIALLEFLEKAAAKEVPIRVFGTDISNRAIERARAGRYVANIGQEVSAVRLQRFFVQAEGGYQLVKEVRDQCVFATQNVARDPPFSNLDLISCRNLMIYLDPALQQRVMPLFHYGLRSPGFLLLGSAEGVGTFSGFALVDAKHRIFLRVPHAERAVADFGGAGWAPVPHVEARSSDRQSRVSEVQTSADEAILAAVAPVGVVVNDELTILEFRGKLSPFFEPSPGAASLDLLRVVREDLRLDLRRAIDEARAGGQAVQRLGLKVGGDDAPATIDLHVIPFAASAAKGRCFAVLFEHAPPEGGGGNGLSKTSQQVTVEAELRHELASTRQYLQSVVERLEASNEELRALSEESISSNEELHSTNEELQTAKEELQATNEELRTINEEMIERNATTTRLADDLANVLESVSIPIVILGRDSRIRRFTPAAGPLMSLIGADVGRPIADIQPKIHAPELPRMIEEVLARFAPVEAIVQGDDQRWYRLNVRPYITSDHRVDGTVISVFDVDALKRTELLLTAARDYAEGIVETVREGLVVLDGDLRVQSANPAFYETFKLSTAEVEKQRFFELDGGVWDVPELHRILDQGQPAERRIEREFPRIGSRIFLVTARRVAGTAWLLLALDDITESARADAVRRSEDGFRRMLTVAADGIVMSDAVGRIVFANDAIAKMLGYAPQEMLGMSADQLLPEPPREAQTRLRAGYDPGPASRNAGRHVDRIARHRDGRELPVEVVLSVMDATEGRLEVKFVTDITERREAERKILEYQENLQRMAFDATVAEEQERRRIAVDLHDRIGQALAAARLKMMSAQERTGGEAQAPIQQALDLVAQTIADTRTLLFDLSPPVLYDLGFREALSWLAEDVEAREGLHVEIIEDAPQPPLDETTAAILFRSVRELLMNVVKHSDVRHVKVALRRDADVYEIEVSDGGRGFDIDAVARSGGNGFGLFSVREQMSRLRGTLRVVAAPAQGTRVTLRVPVSAATTSESMRASAP